MGLFDSLLGKKVFCSVCGAPLSVPPGPEEEEPVCSERCREALRRLSGAPETPASGDVPSAVHEVFGLPEVAVYVFRTNDPAQFYALQEQIIDRECEPDLRVSRLDGPDVSLVAVAGPLGTLGRYRKAMRMQMGPLAREVKVQPEKVRPDATYSNVSASGVLRPNDPAVMALCDKIRRGEFQPVFTGPPSVPPSSSAPVLRAMTDDILMDHALDLVTRHVSFFPGGVLKVEADGVCEAALLFAELARRRPDDPEPAYLEAAALALGMRQEAARERLDAVLQRFPEHRDSCLLAATGKSIFAFPVYRMGDPIPGSIRGRTKDVAIALTRSGRRARPIMFINLRGRPAPVDPNPVARPIFFEAQGVPIIGVDVLYRGSHELLFEAIVAGFEEHDGRSCVAPRACHLFRADALPIVIHEEERPVLCVEAEFEPQAHQAFKACEEVFRHMQPKAFPVDQLSKALEEFERVGAPASTSWTSGPGAG